MAAWFWAFLLPYIQKNWTRINADDAEFIWTLRVNPRSYSMGTFRVPNGFCTVGNGPFRIPSETSTRIGRVARMNTDMNIQS